MKLFTAYTWQSCKFIRLFEIQPLKSGVCDDSNLSRKRQQVERSSVPSSAARLKSPGPFSSHESLLILYSTKRLSSAASGEVWGIPRSTLSIIRYPNNHNCSRTTNDCHIKSEFIDRLTIRRRTSSCDASS